MRVRINRPKPITLSRYDVVINEAQNTKTVWITASTAWSNLHMNHIRTEKISVLFKLGEPRAPSLPSLQTAVDYLYHALFSERDTVKNQFEFIELLSSSRVNTLSVAHRTMASGREELESNESKQNLRTCKNESTNAMNRTTTVLFFKVNWNESEELWLIAFRYK